MSRQIIANVHNGRLLEAALLGVLAGLAPAGCDNGRWGPNGPGPAWRRGQADQAQQVPYPINLLLPREIRIHPFTATRTFDKTGGVKGLQVSVEAQDVYGDPTKAFGDFRFELYTYQPSAPDKRGKRIAVWDEPLSDPKKNRIHWQIHRWYEFKLQWDRPIPVGQRFVLVAIFSSPFTERLFDERVAVSGK